MSIPCCYQVSLQHLVGILVYSKANIQVRPFTSFAVKNSHQVQGYHLPCLYLAATRSVSSKLAGILAHSKSFVNVWPLTSSAVENSHQVQGYHLPCLYLAATRSVSSTWWKTCPQQGQRSGQAFDKLCSGEFSSSPRLSSSLSIPCCYQVSLQQLD